MANRYSSLPIFGDDSVSDSVVAKEIGVAKGVKIVKVVKVIDHPAPQPAQQKAKSKAFTVWVGRPKQYPAARKPKTVTFAALPFVFKQDEFPTLSH